MDRPGPLQPLAQFPFHGDPGQRDSTKKGRIVRQEGPLIFYRCLVRYQWLLTEFGTRTPEQWDVPLLQRQRLALKEDADTYIRDFILRHPGADNEDEEGDDDDDDTDSCFYCERVTGAITRVGEFKRGLFDYVRAKRLPATPAHVAFDQIRLPRKIESFSIKEHQTLIESLKDDQNTGKAVFQAVHEGCQGPKNLRLCTACHASGVWTKHTDCEIHRGSKDHGTVKKMPAQYILHMRVKVVVEGRRKSPEAIARATE